LLHDVFANILHGLQVRLEKVVIDSLSGNAFFAQLYLRQNDALMIADARPSDAVALALKCQAPIYVADAVLQSAGKQEDVAMMEEAQGPPTSAEDVQAWLEDIRPEDFANPE
jgi:bifunctional DNase/RNase